MTFLQNSLFSFLKSVHLELLNALFGLFLSCLYQKIEIEQLGISENNKDVWNKTALTPITFWNKFENKKVVSTLCSTYALFSSAYLAD